MTDFADFKNLPAEERDSLGFQQWKWQNRMGTHGPKCYGYGPAHYECAMREIAHLQERVQQLGEAARENRSRSVIELEAKLAASQKDTQRLDFIASPLQSIANITLPTEIVMQNLRGLRDAIDATMALSRQHQTTP